MHSVQSGIPLLICVASLSLLFSCHSGEGDPPPNMILIMSDDHAQRAISAYGDALVETPNIDRLAREGALMKNSFVTNSICAPSRAVILTGQYSHMNELRDNADAFDTSRHTFVKSLRNAGYQTGIVGKWHLKTLPSGFDYWNILIGQGQYYNPTLIEMGDTTRKTGYATDLITDLAIQFLESRDSTRPFCLLVHHKAPHRNFMPNTKHLPLFENRTFPLPETFYDDYASRSEAARIQDMRVEDMFLSMDMKLQPGEYTIPESSGGMADWDAPVVWQRMYARLTPEQKRAWDAYYNSGNASFREVEHNKEKRLLWKYQRYIRDYLKCVYSVDENVGRLLDYLDAADLAENTIVAYTSDQGFYLGEHGWYDKRFMYEESMRTPFLIRYPKEITRQTVVDQLIINADYGPSLLDFAGIPVPDGMQGRSFRPLLRMAGDPVSWRDAVYYHYYQSGGWHRVPKHEGVRTDRYKLIRFYELEYGWELYDLERDPNELKNQYQNPEYAGIVNRMTGKLDSLRKVLQVPPNE